MANGVVAVAAPRQIDFLRVFQDFLWSMSGVLALLGLTASVVGGLVATGGSVLGPGARVLFQAAHRSIALASLGFLFAHVALQIAYERVAPHHVLLPFGADPSVAFGVVASDLVLVLVVTGAFRRRFTGGERPRLWRALHVTAYLCWPLAIVHGLTAGRQASGFVVLCYALCLVAVGLGLVFRLFLAPQSGAAPGGAERRVSVVRSGEPEDDSEDEARRPGAPATRDPAALTDDLAFWAAIKDGPP